MPLAAQPEGAAGLGAALEQCLALHQRGDTIEALRLCQDMLRTRPDSADAWNVAGVLSAARGALTAAERFYRQAIALDDRFTEAHSNLGGVLCGMGRAAEGCAAFERALAIQPDNAAAADNLLLASLCVPGLDPAAVAERHRHWGRRVEAAVTPLPLPPTARRPGTRPLRLGYVSADFKRHAVAHFLEPLLAHHDPSRVEVHCFVNLPGPGDSVTARLKTLVPHWHPIAGRGDDEVAREIAALEIDVLVDLGGHTAGHRLGVFARRPAPVQISFLGYPATTGLTRIDHRLTDAFSDPPGMTEALHTERLVRLPGGFLCFGPPEQARGPLPPRSPGDTVRFGSFNDASKLSTAVLSLWARVVAGTPGARLVLKARGFGDAGVRDRVLVDLRLAGLPRERVDLLGFQPDLPQHLRCYEQVDIALDTFPYNGTTTSCEALWMGVPVVSLAGRAHVSRVGGALLHTIGLPELCASDEAQFIEIATRLAADRPRLAELRAGMRARLSASPLLDAPAYVRKLEDTFIALAGQQP